MDYEAWAAVIMFVALISLPGWSALYIARKRDDPTTYASMEATIRALSEQVRGMHAEISRLQNKVADLTLGVGVLSSQLMGLGHLPDYVPAAAEKEADPPMDTTAIYNRLIREFDVNELDDLAYRMGVDVGELAADTKSGRARELVQYAERHGELNKLVASLSDVRPKRSKR